MEMKGIKKILPKSLMLSINQSCSLVRASLENGWTNLAIYFFLNVRNSSNRIFRKGKIENDKKKIGKNSAF